jgi:hypothetical protein
MEKNFLNSDICFFCGKEKTSFNEEHIFPDTIGGLFSHKICTECNTKLNKNVDTPFVNSIYISYLRQLNNLKKQSNRPIKDPFKDIKITIGEDKYNLHLNSDGRIFRKIIPKQEIINNNINNGIAFTIDASYEKTNVEPFRQKLEKKYNTKFFIGERIIKKQEEDLFNIQIPLDNDILILEFIKVAIEFSLLYCKQLRESKFIGLFLDLLLEKKYSNELFPLLNDYSESLKKLFPFNSIETAHALFLGCEEGIGLYSVCKIFNIQYAFVIDPEIKSLDKPFYVFYNDFKTRQKKIVSLKKFINAQLILKNIEPNVTINKNQISTIYYGEEKKPLEIFDLTNIIPPDIINGDFIDNLEFIYDSNIFILNDKNFIPIKVKYIAELEEIQITK